jgi:1-acyl-sn-glycerol-3-phosphate acyltransferase
MAAGSMTSSVQRQDAWWWRLFATGFAYTLFAIGALFLRLVVFPAQRVFPGAAARRHHRARKTIQFTFKTFLRLLARLGVITYEFNGVHHLGRPGQMVIANHPSLLDVAFLISHIDNANCIVKHALLRNPFTYGPVTRAGYITNDESVEMLERATQTLQAGETLVVFPEGTRTEPGTMPHFHRGACAIALRGARVVTPVVIRMNADSLTKSQPWYRIPAKRLHYHLQVGPDIDPAQWLNDRPMPIAGRRMNDFLHTYFTAELSPHGSTGT